MLFSLFNHLTSHKRRGTSGREVFQQYDPFNRNKQEQKPTGMIDLGQQLKQQADASSKVSTNSLDRKSTNKFGTPKKTQSMEDSFR